MRKGILLFSIAIAAFAPASAGAATTTFTSTELSNLIPAPMTSTGPAEFFPQSIPVSGLPPAGVTDVDVTLFSFSHIHPQDVDMMLQGPGGQTVMLMSDSGGPPTVNTDIVVNDEGPVSMPSGADFVLGAQYMPTDNGTMTDLGESIPGAPAGPYGNALSVFDGVDPNGAWHLYAYDDTSGDVGNLSGWKLRITTADPVQSTPPVITPPVITPPKTKKCKKKRKRAAKAKKRCRKKK